MTGDTNDTATITAGTNGALEITTVDTTGAAANITISADGTSELAGTTVTLNSSGNITLDADDGTITFADGGSSLGTITSSGYSGNAATVTVTDNESTAETNLITFVANGGSSTGSHGLEMDGDLTYNPNTGTLTATNLAGTIQTVSQGTISTLAGLTAVGTTTILTTFSGPIKVNEGITVDDIVIDGKVITMTGDTNGTATITAGTNGALAITTVDTATAGADITITADGNIALDAVDGITLDAGATITGNVSNEITLNVQGASGQSVNIFNVEDNGNTDYLTVSSSGVTTASSLVATTANINGGTIINTSVGATNASTGAFTTLSASSDLTLNGDIVANTVGNNANVFASTTGTTTLGGGPVDIGAADQTITIKGNLVVNGTTSSSNGSTVSGTIENAEKVAVSTSTSTNSSNYLTFVEGTTGNLSINVDTGLNYNPNTDTLTTSSLVLNTGATITGNTPSTVTLNVQGASSQSENIFNVEENDGTDRLTVSNSGVTTASSLVATTADINGGTIDDVTIGDSDPCTYLRVDDIVIDGKVITMTGDTNGTATITAGTDGALEITTDDTSGASANITITADGTSELAGTAVTLNSSGNITLDADGGTITFADNNVSLGTITSSGYSGNAATATTCTGNAATASGLNMLPLTINTNLVKGKTYINTGSSLTHTLPIPSAVNEIITIYSTSAFDLKHNGGSTKAEILTHTKTLCISNGTNATNWNCMTFASGGELTFS